jgi:hypothetical protein
MALGQIYTNNINCCKNADNLSLKPLFPGINYQLNIYVSVYKFTVHVA